MEEIVDNKVLEKILGGILNDENILEITHKTYDMSYMQVMEFFKERKLYHIASAIDYYDGSRNVMETYKKQVNDVVFDLAKLLNHQGLAHHHIARYFGTIK